MLSPRARIVLLMLLPMVLLSLFLLSSQRAVFLHDIDLEIPYMKFSPGTWVQREERAYKETLRERKAWIKSFGPPEDIEAFPLVQKVYTLWDFFTPAFQCPYRVSRIGRRGDGGKFICGMEEVAKKDKCVVYSFGVNQDSSFEVAILERAPGCEVWGYDFSVSQWGPDMSEHKDASKRAYFKPYGLSTRDTHSETDNPKMYTLKSLMALNGHTHIDILKVDIEENEFDVLPSIIDDFDVLPFSQLQLEIHVWHDHEKFPYFLKWWEKLEAAGLRPFWTEPNLIHVNLQRGMRPDVAEYSFLNIRGNQGLIPELPY